MTLLVIATLLLPAIVGHSLGDIWAAASFRTPSELARYAQRRMSGHPNIEAVFGRPVNWVIASQERQPPESPLPTLGKGWQTRGVGWPAYDTAGRPLPVQPLPTAAASTGPVLGTRQTRPTRLLVDEAAIAAAFRDAAAGDILEVQPGTYRVTRPWTTRQAGTRERPIVLRATVPGSVRFEVDTLQAVVVRQPFWVFENLDWQGRCENHNRCEHAFHVVGAAHSTAILNNRMTDFNAHIKVNGEHGIHPDHGLVQWSTLSNTAPRRADKPVVPFDLVAASGWRFADNLVENYPKRARKGISYGVFMKGGGEGGRIERNLIICTRSAVSQPGVRVGISIGGGGTGQRSCRGGRCDFEHRQGVVANNVVAHCNDFGIDIYRSVQTQVVHNTLINTAGIESRNAPAEAVVSGNLLEGRIRARSGGTLSATNNLVDALPGRLDEPDALRLGWRALPELVPRAATALDDFCAQPRPLMQPPGATVAPDCSAMPAGR